MTTDERLGRIDERLEHLQHELLGNGQPGKIEMLTVRLSAMERWRSYVTGALVVITFALTAAVTIGGGILLAKLKGQ